MSELTFEQMLEESFKTIHTGEVVEGTVIAVKPEEIVLNIGYKSDGILTKNEYTNEPNVDLTKLVKVDDKLDVKIIKVNDGEGQVLLSYKRLALEKGNKRIEDAFNNKEYDKAVANFEKVTKEELGVEGNLFYAISLIEVNQFDKAEAILIGINEGGSVYKEKAIWYLGLSKLKQKKYEECKVILETLTNDAEDYDKAQEILKKL